MLPEDGDSGCRSSQCIADLRATDPRDDKKRIEAIKGGLLKGSYQWVLDHPEFRRWRAGTVRRREHVAGEQAPAVAQLCSGRHSTMLTMAALPHEDAAVRPVPTFNGGVLTTSQSAMRRGSLNAAAGWATEKGGWL